VGLKSPGDPVAQLTGWWLLVAVCWSWPSLAPAADLWRELQPGLELARFDSGQRKPAPQGDLLVLRVDPDVWPLQVLATDLQPDGRERNVRQWCQDLDLVAAVNAGMYQADGRTHVGFCVIDGEVQNRFANDYLSAAAFDPIDPNEPPFRIFDLDEISLDEIKRHYRDVVQNLRLIKRGRENRWEPADQSWREAALGEDNAGRALLIYCTTPRSMYEFNEILLALPIDLDCAQHLEGGAHARIWFAHPEFTPGDHPGWDRGPGPIVPNIIGIAR
jgi:hypothetical protein